MSSAFSESALCAKSNFQHGAMQQPGNKRRTLALHFGTFAIKYIASPKYVEWQNYGIAYGSQHRSIKTSHVDPDPPNGRTLDSGSV